MGILNIPFFHNHLLTIKIMNYLYSKNQFLNTMSFYVGLLNTLYSSELNFYLIKYNGDIYGSKEEGYDNNR
jgi:hypothetical protein